MNRGDQRLLELAHDLADVLHLAALAFEVGDAARFGQRVEQLVGQLQARKQIAAQVQQVFAELLQRVAFALHIGTAGVPGSFEFGLEFKVEFAAFGNELAFYEVAFFWFA